MIFTLLVCHAFAAETVPRMWTDAAMASVEVPLAHEPSSPVHAPEAYYYSIPVRPVLKTYPVYHPDHEPKGYMEMLRQQEPVVLFDASKLRTRQDWIRAGELVFDSPLNIGPQMLENVRNADWYRDAGVLLTKEGINPFLVYVIRQKGRIEVGGNSCATCHIRVMPDQSVIKGAQGNYAFERGFGLSMKDGRSLDQIKRGQRFLFAAPWAKPDLQEGLAEKTMAEISSWHKAVPPGVMARHRTSPLSPVQVPDLIGVKDRKYLDRTGLQLHRGPEDLMRYAALNQRGDYLAKFGDFSPLGRDGSLPPADTERRYSDEQLYALALYTYSLTPPPNPNRPNALSERGRKVFEKAACAMCHPAPLYTNNKLTPVVGFTVPEEHKKKYDIMPVVVGTDTTLALRTRRGTGYYKVPSLQGVWYRGPFEHNGSVATLEDWFDSNRLRDDYVPTGWKGAGATRAVKGHEFGLNLQSEDKRALIAFLKTL